MAIARALASEPKVLILDEAVASLDVSIQAQVLNLLADIREQTGVTYLFISHDLAVVRQVSDEAVVMRRGEIVERGATAQVLDDPQHPYTQTLLKAVPRQGWKPVRSLQRALAGSMIGERAHDKEADMPVTVQELGPAPLDPAGRPGHGADARRRAAGDRRLPARRVPAGTPRCSCGCPTTSAAATRSCRCWRRT